MEVKMNKKGFTLVELLAVIVIIGILAVIVVPISSNAYKNSKIKNEEIFVKKLSDVISDYIALNSNEIVFSNEPEKIIEATKTVNNEITYAVTVKQATITVQNIIGSNLITDNDFKNPGNKDALCNKEAEIEVYRDSDYVYCHKIKKDSLGCLTKEYKDTVIDSLYIVNTCSWSPNNG